MFSKNESRLKFSVFVVGLTTMITQIILLRNFLSVTNGMELVIGIILSNWLLITALGAFIGQYIVMKELDFRIGFFAHIMLGVLPLLIAFLIIYLKNYIFLPGKAISLAEIYFGSMVMLLPFCLISGLLFSKFSLIYSSEIKSNAIYKIYGIEALGSILGGVLFNLFLIYQFNTFLILKLVMAGNFIIALTLYFIGKKNKLPWIAGIAAIIGGGAILSQDLEHIAYEKFFRNQTLIEILETQYGNLASTEAAGQINFYENGVLLFSTDNIIESEERVHYAMLQHPDPKKVLLISGSALGIIDEILKYGVESVDYLEIDPGIIKLTKKHKKFSYSDNKVNIYNQDARLFLKKTNSKYDVILINLPDPINAQINRYYTLEFFEETKENLSPNGIIATSLSGTANYLSDESRQLYTALFSTIKLAFNNVIIIPGQRNYFLASEVPLSAKISQLAESRSISTSYVNPFYLDDELIMERQMQIKESLIPEILINYDFYPVVYLFQMKLWLSKFNYQILYFILATIVMVAVFIRLNSVNKGLFMTGFSATSLEIILLLAFQIIYGYVYFILGVFLTIFMMGLVLGSLFLYKKIKTNQKNFSIIQYILGICSILLPFILFRLNTGSMPEVIVHSIFIFLMLSIGILTGIQFSLGTNISLSSISRTSATAYGSDSLGSALGALIVATYLIPQFGLVKVCLIIGILNIITGLFILIRK